MCKQTPLRSSCRHLAEHLLLSPGCPRVRPPPLGELFLEMGIIVKPCWCPFSLSLASPDPWEELTPQFPAIQDETRGRSAHIQDGLGAAKYIISSLGSADQSHSPDENTKAQRGQVASSGSLHPWEVEEPDIWLRGDSGHCCPCWGVYYSL